MNIKKVLVIGAGTMGRGIAQWFAQQDVEVELIDAVSEMAQKSLTMIHTSWKKLESKGKFSQAQIKGYKKCLTISTIEDHSTDCDLVIEAIIENEKIKRELFLKLDQNMKAECILASNTSSIPITTIARDLSAARKKKTIGLHFFNPATIMKLVEVIKTTWSDDQ